MARRSTKAGGRIPATRHRVSLITREVREPVIAGLARAHPGDVDACWRALADAESPRTHVFVSSSEIHMAHQLRKSREQVTELARAAVARAAAHCPDVEFSPMDATRSDPAFLHELLETVIAAGATTVNIPDTVGYALPHEFGALISGVAEHVPNIARARISVHCHDDLGLATANSLAGLLPRGAPGRGRDQRHRRARRQHRARGSDHGARDARRSRRAAQRRAHRGALPREPPGRARLRARRAAAQVGRRAQRLSATPPASTRTAC